MQPLCRCSAALVAEIWVPLCILCATSMAAQDRGLRPTSIVLEACTTTPTVGTYKERGGLWEKVGTDAVWSP